MLAGKHACSAPPGWALALPGHCLTFASLRNPGMKPSLPRCSRPSCHLRTERYTHREAYTGPHRQSASFFAFKDAQKQFQIEISGQSYYETPHGFMWRA